MLNTSQRWVIGGTLIMAAAMGVGRFAYTPLLPEMMSEFGWSLAQAGDVGSANYLGYIIGALLAPRALRSPTPLIWLAASIAASVVSTYLGVVVTAFWAWCAVRLVAGIASAYCLIMVATLIAQKLLQTGQTRLVNLHFTGVGLGIVLTVLITWRGGAVADQWAGLTALAAALMAVAWLSMRTEDTPVTVPAPPASGQGATPGLWRLVLGYGGFGYGYVVTATFIVAMARDLDASQSIEQATWLGVGLAVIPSIYLWQRAADRFGLVPALGAAYLLEAAGVLIAGLLPSVGALILGGALLGGTFAAITALGLAAARRHAPHDPARAIGRMTAAFAGGQLIGPALSGRLAELSGGFAVPSVVAGGLLVLGCALLIHFPDPASRTRQTT